LGGNTLGTLVYIRNTINTKDEFYAAEREYIDEVEPLYGEAAQKVSLAMLASPFRAELEKELGTLYFKNLEIAVRTFSPDIIELIQQENKLSSEQRNKRLLDAAFFPFHIDPVDQEFIRVRSPFSPLPYC